MRVFFISCNFLIRQIVLHGRGKLNFEGQFRRILFRLQKGVMERGLVVKNVIFFNTAGTFQNSVALVNKSNQADKQGVDELIFIGQQRFVTEDIQQLGRSNVFVLNFQNVVGVLSEVADRLFANLFGKLNG